MTTITIDIVLISLMGISDVACMGLAVIINAIAIN